MRRTACTVVEIFSALSQDFAEIVNQSWSMNAALSWFVVALHLLRQRRSICFAETATYRL